MKFHPISTYFQLSTTFGEGVKMPWKIFVLFFGQNHENSTCDNPWKNIVGLVGHVAHHIAERTAT